MQGKAYFFCALALFTMVTRGQAGDREDFYRLKEFLFKDYKKGVRPGRNDSNRTLVDISFSQFSVVDRVCHSFTKKRWYTFVCLSVCLTWYLFSRLLSTLLRIDDYQQRMKSNAILKVTWVDEYLSWNATNYSNIDSILVKQSSIWLPDIVVGNTVTTQTYPGFDNLQVRVWSNGTVNWYPIGVFDTSCDLDVTFYPFDIQECDIVIKSSLSYRVLVNKTPFEKNRFSSDNIWKIIDATIKKGESEHVDITLSLQLKRRSTYFVLNIFVPIFVLTMTSSMPFALPADSGERMGLSVTLLLSFTVYLTIIANAMPQSSVQLSLLMLYVLLMLGLNALSVLLCVLILRLHHRSSSKPLGKRTSKVILYLQQLMLRAKAKLKSTKVKAKRHQYNKPIFTVDKLINAVSETIGIAPTDDDHRGPSEDASTSSNVSPITGQQAGETYDLAPADDDHRGPSGDPSTSSKVSPITGQQAGETYDLAPADDDHRGPSGDASTSSKVSPINGQQAGETLSLFFFIIFLLYSVGITIIFGIAVAGGGARQFVANTPD